jgi:hypothetical protein
MVSRSQARKHRDVLLGQRRDPLLSAFADRPDVRAGTELRIGANVSGLNMSQRSRAASAYGPGR